MRLLIATLILIMSVHISYSAECTDNMQAFNKHQLVIKGLMDLNFQGKLNKPTADAIGERLKEGNKYQEAGDFDKACGIYDSIIDEYGFDKSFGQPPAPEKEEPPESAEGSTSDEASAAPQSATSEAVAAPSSVE